MALSKDLLREAYTFDDVLLKPGLSDTLPSDVDIRSRITRAVALKIPIAEIAWIGTQTPLVHTIIRTKRAAALRHFDCAPAAETSAAGSAGMVPSFVTWTRLRLRLRSSSSAVRWAMVYIQGIGLAPRSK